MSRRPRIGPGLVLGAVAVCLGGCEAKGQRDQYYGTDVGALYQPPEASAGAADTPGAGDALGGGAADAGADAAADAAADLPAADGGNQDGGAVDGAADR